MFQTPGRVATQLVETPDGQIFFTVRRTVDRTLAVNEMQKTISPYPFVG